AGYPANCRDRRVTGVIRIIELKGLFGRIKPLWRLHVATAGLKDYASESTRQNDWHDSLSLPYSRKAREWWHGRRVQGRRYRTSTFCCSEVLARGAGPRSTDSRTLPPRGPRRLCSESSEHLHRPRDRQAQRPVLHRDC